MQWFARHKSKLSKENDPSKKIRAILDKKQRKTLDNIYCMKKLPSKREILRVSKRLNASVRMINDYLEQKRTLVIQIKPKQRKGGFRSACSESHLKILENLYAQNKYISPDEGIKLSYDMGLPENYRV